MLDHSDISHVRAKPTRALDQVTLSTSRGMYRLLGSDGAGKATLMRTGAALRAPMDGSIQVCIWTRPFAGRTAVHIVADTDTGNAFQAIGGGLGNLHFSTLAYSRHAG